VIASPPAFPSWSRWRVASPRRCPTRSSSATWCRTACSALIDAAFRFDEARGIKFETFAERRVRGAMIDALRRDAWPRGVRRQRRELETAREELRRELGASRRSPISPSASAPTSAASAARSSASIRSSRRRRCRRARTSTTRRCPPRSCPSEPTAPDRAYEELEVRDRVRAAIASLPPRERKVIGLYYYAEATMKQIGAEIGVNESRVSQLHARAIQRLRKALGADCSMEEAARALRPAILSFQQTMTRVKMAKAAGEKRRPRSSCLQALRGETAAEAPRDLARQRPPPSPRALTQEVVSGSWALDVGMDPGFSHVLAYRPAQGRRKPQARRPTQGCRISCAVRRRSPAA
jgi:RNA polymerase sigma factor for flagellar operon FliA